MGDRINSYKELRVYQSAMEAAMEIFQITKSFPPEEKYSMVDQMAVLHGPYALTLPKHGVSEGIRRHLSQN